MFGYLLVQLLAADSPRLLCKYFFLHCDPKESFTFTFTFYSYSLEMLEKSEPPTIPDGYCMSVAYACLLDVVRSISLVVENIPSSSSAGDAPASSSQPSINPTITNDEDDAFSIQLVNSSWCGLLAALTLLLETRYCSECQCN